MTDIGSWDAAEPADGTVESDAPGVSPGDAIDAADTAEWEAAGIEPSDEWFESTSPTEEIAPGNLGEDESNGPGWGPIYHGQTEVDGELIDVTFNMKSNTNGETTDYLISPGHNTKEVHDQSPPHDPYYHAHAWDQNTDHPNHDDRDLGVLNTDADEGLAT